MAFVAYGRAKAPALARILRGTAGAGEADEPPLPAALVRNDNLTFLLDDEAASQLVPASAS